ncbi:MAG: RHS repeat-associated core domain-containing protein [Nitrospira sp.]|nr:RHS repeat-associated core domain-containing protein [Nitrospira sp.]
MAQPCTCTGRQLDQETGRYYDRARYYDAATERFLQKDPVRCVHGVNLYAYAMNNPANLADAIGLCRAVGH